MGREVFIRFSIYLVVVLALAVCDFIMGILASKISGIPIQSGKMATGLYKKTGNIVCMAVFIGVDITLAFLGGYAIKYVFSTTVFIYICAMELTSIGENYLRGDTENRGFITEVIRKIFERKEKK